jgi:hypothetical protein
MGARHRRFSRPPLNLSVSTYLAASFVCDAHQSKIFGSGIPIMFPGPNTWTLNILPLGQFPRTVSPIHIAQQCDPFAT